MVFKHHLILVSWLLAKSKKSALAKHNISLFPEIQSCSLVHHMHLYKKILTRTRDLYEKEGRAGTLQPAACSPPRSLHRLFDFNAHTAGGTMCAHLFRMPFPASCCDAEREQKQFCKSTEVLLSFCSTHHSVWGEHALHIHFWVCQAAQLWWPLRSEVEAWVNLQTLLWLLVWYLISLPRKQRGMGSWTACPVQEWGRKRVYSLEISVPWADMGGLQEWFTADIFSGTRKGLIRKRFFSKKTKEIEIKPRVMRQWENFM